MNNAGSTICFDYRRLDIYYEIRDSKRVQTVGGRLRYMTERYRNSPIESSSHNTRSKRQRLRVEVAKWTTCSRLLSLSPIRIIRSPATYVSNYPRAGLCFLASGFVLPSSVVWPCLVPLTTHRATPSHKPILLSISQNAPRSFPPWSSDQPITGLLLLAATEPCTTSDGRFRPSRTHQRPLLVPND